MKGVICVSKNPPLYKFIRLANVNLTPTDIYNRLTGKKKFLLESTFQHKKKGKFSFIGEEPYMGIIGNGSETTMYHYETGVTEKFGENALVVLKKYLPKIDLDISLPFYGGAIGYVGYDAIRQFECIGSDLPDDIQMPDIHFLLYKTTIIIDHKEDRVYLVAVNVEQELETELDERLNKLEEKLKNGSEIGDIEVSSVQFFPEITEDTFIKKVEEAKEYIQKGDIFQVVLSQRFIAQIDGDPFHIYQKLRKANPSPYMFYIDFGDYTLLGASPESLIQTEGREMITNPIAGTRPRGKTDEEDSRLAEELLSDEKELAEHQMLVDLSRNDLGKVAKSGTIELPTYMKIEKYQHVMHIVSEVKGQLRDDLMSVDALISCLPAGTVSGAPKIRAMQIINELEEKKRGVYAGGVGYINYNFDLNMALAIRSLVIIDGKAYLQAGAGIVHDSNAYLEYEETLNKAKSLMEVVQNVFID